ncbi:MAG TPA: hypothetical protein DDY88_08335 [Actinobacteria bacterium]|nr:hypothetical protein [Actinomycetota bacterium]
MTQEPEHPREMGERRLPMALAVLAVGGLVLIVPEEFRLSNVLHYAYCVLLLVMLIVLIVGDPGRIDKQHRWLRIVSGALIALITALTMMSAARLVLGILEHADFATPAQLLIIGGAIWTINVIAFALWYWHLDSGGPAARARGELPTNPAFIFPEQSIPALVAQGWYPKFVDYLALSFNTALAFSPTDVAAIRHWPKLCMILESLISLILVALVLARAVNVL